MLDRNDTSALVNLFLPVEFTGHSKILKSRIEEQLADYVLHDPFVLESLDKLKRHDEDTQRHCVSVGYICSELAFACRLPLFAIDLVVTAGMLHDIGKLWVPVELLNQAESLREDQVAVIRQHIRNGFDYLNGKVDEEIRQIAVRHHEHKSNHPYPRQKERRTVRRASERREPDSDLRVTLGEIVSLADIFDAMTRGRNYRQNAKFSIDELLQHVKNEHNGSPELFGCLQEIVKQRLAELGDR